MSRIRSISLALLLLIATPAGGIDQKAYPVQDVGGVGWLLTPAKGGAFSKIDDPACTELPCGLDSDFIYSTDSTQIQTVQIGLPPMRGAYSSALVSVTIRGKSTNSVASSRVSYEVTDSVGTPLATGSLYLYVGGFVNNRIMADVRVRQSQLPLSVRLQPVAACVLTSPDSSCNIAISSVEVDYRSITTSVYPVN